MLAHEKFEVNSEREQRRYPARNKRALLDITRKEEINPEHERDRYPDQYCYISLGQHVYPPMTVIEGNLAELTAARPLVIPCPELPGNTLT